jgi:hypothetical protein
VHEHFAAFRWEIEQPRVRLDPDHGLTAFMTLNDRGKDLTILEKLKALLLQFVYDAYRAKVDNAAPLIARLHTVFGQFYAVVDRCIHVNLFSNTKADDDAVKLISCYIRLDRDAIAIWQGPDQAYEEYFRHKLLNVPVGKIPVIMQPWCDGIEQLADQLSHLVEYIDCPSPYDAIQSLHFPGFTLPEDYCATLISLGLQPHLLALLLKFRSQFGVEWHQRFPGPANNLSLIPIQGLLNDVEQRARAVQPPSPQALFDYIESFRSSDCTPRKEISMIEVVERMQLVN